LSYSRFALGFTGKRRVAALSDAAFRLWVSAIDYSREQLTDGRIETLDLKLIHRGGASTEWQPKHIQELVAAGLWVQQEANVWVIEDYTGWQDSAEKVREKRDNARKRMQSVRANKQRTSSERSREVRSGRVFTHISSISSSQGGTGGTGGSEPPEVFDAAHPEFEEPPPPTRPLNVKPSEPMTPAPVPVVEETALQRAARRMLHGGGQAQNARFERGCANRWPEVERILRLDMELRGSNDFPRTESDGRVVLLLQRYAEGFTPDELEDVVRRARADEYWGNVQLKGVLKDPANFEAMGKPRGRTGGDDSPRASGAPITLTAAEAAKWR
jgi:hypothetical protein